MSKEEILDNKYEPKNFETAIYQEWEQKICMSTGETCYTAQ